MSFLHSGWTVLSLPKVGNRLFLGDLTVLKKFMLLAVLVGSLAIPASASEVPTLQIEFGADAATILGVSEAPSRVNAAQSGSDLAGCTASATCRNGITISCSNSGSSTACSSSDHNCPFTQGWVKCGSSTQNCSASCPVSNCPVRPGCSYKFNKFTHCCVDTLNDPNSYCPEYCQ